MIECPQLPIEGFRALFEGSKTKILATDQDGTFLELEIDEAVDYALEVDTLHFAWTWPGQWKSTTFQFGARELVAAIKSETEAVERIRPVYRLAAIKEMMNR